MKILYDVNVNQYRSKQADHHHVIVVTVGRLRLVALPEGMRLEPIGELPAKCTRMISDRNMMFAPDQVKSFIQAGINAATNEAMQIAIQREVPDTLPMNQSGYEYEYKINVRGAPPPEQAPAATPKTHEETHYWRLRAAREQELRRELERVTAVPNLIASNGPSFKNLGAEKAEINRLRGKYPDLEASQLRTLVAGLRHAKRLGAEKDEASGLRAFPGAKSMFTVQVQGPSCPNCNGMKGWVVGYEKCPDCGWDGTMCAACGGSAPMTASSLCSACKRDREDLARREKDKGASCAKCGTMAHPIREGDGGYCIICVEFLRENAKKRGEFWERHRAYHLDRREQEKDARPECGGTGEACPECGGTGEVVLFTSVQPCSRGCKK